MQCLGIILFITIILMYALTLGCNVYFFKLMWNRFLHFFLFYYLFIFLFYLFFIDICICILNVIWQLNALNGFSFNGY